MKIRRFLSLMLCISLFFSMCISSVRAADSVQYFLDISGWYADKNYFTPSGEAKDASLGMQQNYTTSISKLSDAKKYLRGYIDDCLIEQFDFRFDGDYHKESKTSKWGCYWLTSTQNPQARKFRLKNQSGFSTDQAHIILWYMENSNGLQISCYYSYDLVPMMQEGILVSPRLDLTQFGKVPENAMQDFRYWDTETVTYRGEPSVYADHQIINYTAKKEIVEEYIAMLCKNGYSIVDEQSASSWLNGYHFWGLKCDAIPITGNITMIGSDTPCHISISWTKSSSSQFTFQISDEIIVQDIGLRRSDNPVSIIPSAPSAGAGLLRLSDGSYQTTDGRLTAEAGTATVIRDGKTYTASTRYETSGNHEIFWVEDYYRSEGIFLKTEQRSLMEGDYFLHRDLARKRPIDGKKDSIAKTNYSETAIAFAHGDHWVGPCFNEENYEELIMRVLYYDQGGEAVIYFYARFAEGTPSEVEALCCVNMLPTDPFKDAIRMEVDDKITLTHSCSIESETYDSYQWEIIEGAENVTLSGTNSQKCKVTATDSGYVALKVTHFYNKIEPDVLSKIPRKVNKSESHIYYLIIE